MLLQLTTKSVSNITITIGTTKGDQDNDCSICLAVTITTNVSLVLFLFLNINDRLLFFLNNDNNNYVVSTTSILVYCKRAHLQLYYFMLGFLLFCFYKGEKLLKYTLTRSKVLKQLFQHINSALLIYKVGCIKNRNNMDVSNLEVGYYQNKLSGSRI